MLQIATSLQMLFPVQDPVETAPWKCIHLMQQTSTLPPLADPRMHKDCSDPPSFVADGLYLGGVREAADAQCLQSLGITHILNAAREVQDLHPGQFQYWHLYVKDSTSERLFPYFADVAKWIEQARRTDGKVLVHCYEGVSRSATLVLAERILREKISLADALAQLRASRPQVEPNPRFIHELRQLELQERGQCTQDRLTLFDDLPIPTVSDSSGSVSAEEAVIALMAEAAACSDLMPSQLQGLQQASEQLTHLLDASQAAFNTVLMTAMERFAGTSLHDNAARSAFSSALVTAALKHAGGTAVAAAKCQELFGSFVWHDLCLDAPLLPSQADALIEQLRTASAE